MKKFSILLATIFISFISFVHGENAGKLQKMNSVVLLKKNHEKFMKWKKTISPAQLDYFNELFQGYDQTYHRYLKNLKNEQDQLLLQEYDKSIDHIMKSWPSFLKYHTNVEIFNKSFQDWKDRLSAKKRIMLKNLCSSYEMSYQKYDQDPASKKNQQMIDEQMQLLKIHMQRA